MGKTAKELESLIRRHNNLYFVEHAPEISDAEFDQLVKHLKKIKPASQVLQEIGSDLSATETIRHEVPMLSLDKCYDAKELDHWAEKFSGEAIASPKIDGCAVALRYDAKGNLQLAATRGSGIEGEKITENARFIKSIPQKIKLKNCEVRGEVYMPLSIFSHYQEEFANPRNLAAGAIKQKDPKKTGEYRLSFFAYDLLGVKCKTEVEKRKWLEKNSFQVIDWKCIPKEKMQQVFEKYFQERTKRDYETDGVVFRANTITEQVRLGVTAHHPRFAIAYKFQGESGESTVVDVLWSVSRTGTITPVALITPVELSGAMVSRVSLHNVGLAKKTGVGRGAKVLVMRRGGVIPNIEQVLVEGTPLEVPAHCPSCGASVKQVDDFLYCSNVKKCQVSKIADLEHFTKVVGIDGFGRKLLTKLYETGLVQDAADFYTLTVEDLLPLDRMGETLAKKIVSNVAAYRKIPMDLFLRALGIDELGKHASKILATTYGTLEKIGQVTPEEFVDIHTIGEKIAASVVKGLKEKRPLIEKLLKNGITPVSVRHLEGGSLAGKNFLFTGAMLSMTREEAEKWVEAKGGKLVSGVSKNLDFLVVGDGGGAGSKLEKTRKLAEQGSKIKILNENEFLKIFR